MSKKYQEAGVNLEAGYESIELIKKHVARTGQVAMFGSFGGVFDLSKYNYKSPVLISGTDGVGTKLEIAFQLDKHDTIGIDLVAMCVNDILAQGAKPLYFLDYIATSKNIPTKIEQIVKGIADGCVEADCMLIGGETAEMPDLYQENHYDLAGFVTGCVEKEKLITSKDIKVGYKLIGIKSSGIHSNGYSLVRKVLLKDAKLDLNKVYDPLKNTLGEELLTPTKIYVKPVLAVLEKIKVFGIVHVTGGGFYENISRVLSNNLGVKINKHSFEVLPIFKFIAEHGKISEDEMFNVFNMGIGMILVVEEENINEVLNILENHNEEAFVIGEVTDREGVDICD